MKLYILIPFPYGHDRVQIFPETEDSKVNSIRKVKSKASQRQRNKGKISSCSGLGKAKGKETGKATIHTKTNSKGGFSILGFHTKSGYAKVRPMRGDKQLNLRTLNKAWKKISKVG